MSGLLYATPPLAVTLCSEAGATRGVDRWDETGSGADDSTPADTALITVLCLLRVLQAAAGAAMFTSTFIIINNSVDASNRGRVNGLSMALAAAFRALGPVVGANSFAWALTNGLGAPFDVHFTFNLCALLGMGTSLFGLRWLPGHAYDQARGAQRTSGAGGTTEMASEADI